jgi:ecdysteroid 25-hydroxylase
LICAEGKLWKDQRKVTIEWLRKMGMIKFGAARAELEKRMMVQINDCINVCFVYQPIRTIFDSFFFAPPFQQQRLERLSKQSFLSNPKPILHHTLGNMMNDIVFGKVYKFDDETWEYLQNLQEEGVKYIGVSGAVNFLPFLRYV